MSRQRVIVIGGGVCGLGVGWKLAAAGADVTVFDRGKAGRESTWAAAGMLCPQMELRPQEEDISALGLESMKRWRAFAADLEADSDIPLHYRDEGTLFISADQDAAEQLRFLHDHQIELGMPVEWLSGAEVREREPYISHNVVAGLVCLDDHHIDCRGMTRALAEAFVRRGGDLREDAPVDGVVVDDARLTGVRVNGEVIPADAVVVAAGTWSGMLDGLGGDVKPPVRPVKGQMLMLRQPDERILSHCIWARSSRDFCYMVPKADGTLLIGATVEEVGYNKDVTAGAVLDMLRAAWGVLPSVYDLPIIETWAGLRPASRDGAPVLGATDVDGLFMATGHFRNGILFAPVTAEDVAHAVLTGETTATIAPYGLGRFAA
ncbi:glycine oxidase ThiO [Candidatus Poribacteria bacterium]|jgi:glycine oxidase|nr:glycine oxidase ThiO [Candidatus Poribacteria bacterium]MBT5533949.1 glycine oxidase ThiO [Candidatus Poribacteria bacterium]MBT5715212.1 glycine oxidase ThiO [Candidatus Poribacteria bacterium]MBT7095999.1 glycine oxidase ThiO [Candidatus Poribacteria bacterium]MBT7806113.1 glycine oxidase ThiO [Candidatus Poribacteria bacterium]